MLVEGEIVAGILIIEQSSTLSNLLLRALNAGGHKTTTVITAYDEALKLLEDNYAAGHPYHAIVIGIPESSDSPIKPILGFLHNNPDASDTPVMMLFHEHSASLDAWMNQRGSSQAIPWKQFATLPQHIPHEAEVIEAPITPTFSSGNSSVNVLFIDDSQSARYVYSRLLESMGFPVKLANDLKQAETMASEEKFDLIIIDYYLPDGTGDELCAKLNTDSPNGPMLAIITGSYKEDIIKNCLQAGATDCIFKNEAKELFITRISSLANSIQTRRSIEAERSRLEGILGSVGDGVYGVDETGRITFMNPVGSEILGYPSRHELTGQLAQSALHNDLDESDPTIATLQRSYRTGETLTAHETVFRNSDGMSIPIECTVFPLSIESVRQGSVVVFRDISERKTVEQLQWELTHDSLTSLLNKRQFITQLESAMTVLDGSDAHHALLWIDIDRFEEVIDSTSLMEADRILVDVAGKLSSQLREHDEVARFGGDTFVMMLSNVQLANLFTAAEKCRATIAEIEYAENGDTRHVAASIGVAIIGGNSTSSEYALQQATEACDTAKKKGRDQTYIYIPEEDSQTTQKLEDGWYDRFKSALRKDGFTMLVQPIVRTEHTPTGWKREHPGQLQIPEYRNGNGNGSGPSELIFEVLIRMHSEDNEWISPSVFVPLAERVQMIQEIDQWVIRHALEYLEGVQHDDYHVNLTLNLSNLTLQDPASLDAISELISEHRPALARQLIFEITETAEIESLHNARRFITEIKKLGCRFALDDFGTGFSSFSHLKHLAVDYIKIDGMFIQSMVHNEVDRTMVNSITNMAHSLGLLTIGEHIDSSMILEAARESQVDYVQGNFFGQPVSLDQLNLNDLIAPVDVKTG